MADAVTVEKYQKLLAAYQELKAKNSILKKAVLDAQSAPPPVPEPAPPAAAGHLDETLRRRVRETDAKLREAESTIANLTDHNSQLQRRVQELQQRLQEAPSDSKGPLGGLGFLRPGRKEQQKQAEALQVLDEEFQRKLDENARLHSRIADMEAQALQLRDELTDAQAGREASGAALVRLQQAERSLRAIHADERASLLKLVEEKDKEVSRAVGQVASLESTCEGLRRTVQQLRKNHAAAIAQHTARYNARVQFDDTRVAAYNGANVPVGVAGVHACMRGVAGEAVPIVREWAGLWSSLLAYLQERAAHLGSALGIDAGLIAQCTQLLNDRSRFIKPVERSYAAFHEAGNNDLAPFVEDFARLAQYLIDCASLYCVFEGAASGAQGGAVSGASAQTQRALTAAAHAHAHTAAALARLASPDADPAAPDADLAAPDADPAAPDAGSPPDALEGIVRGVRDVLQHTRALASLFSSLTALEHRLPHTTHLITDTDTCVSSTLSKLTACVGHVVTFLESNRDTLSGAASATRGVRASPLAKSAASGALQERGTRYMALLQHPPPESVPYAEALRARSTAAPPESAALSRQVSELKRALTSLQHEREQALLEASLLTLKLKQRESEGERGAASAPGPAAEGMEEKFGGESESVSREDLIKQHYLARIQSLVDQVEFADAKAVTYYDECRAMAMKLSAAAALHAQQGEDVKVLQGRIAQLTEDLETTKARYEEQLAMMGEHIMSLNEQLRSVEDAAESTRRASAAKKPEKKKGW